MSFAPPDPEHVANLRKSLEIVGPLGHVLIDPENPKHILSGGHRKAADNNWPEEQASFDRVYQFLNKTFTGIAEKTRKSIAEKLIGLHSNVQRSVSDEETKHTFESIDRSSKHSVTILLYYALQSLDQCVERTASLHTPIVICQLFQFLHYFFESLFIFFL